MRHLILLFLFNFPFLLFGQELLTPFEKGNGNQSTSYQECISYYRQLAQQYNEARLFNYGETDCGEPLHLLVLHNNGSSLKMQNREQFLMNIRNNKIPIIMIMNGIHPGEPEGIDASMMWSRDLLAKQDPLLKQAVVCIIPVYNIGGLLKRRPNTRVNQEGPELQGFRGNAQNLDLNRDFVKGDAKNTWAFWQIYHDWRPDVFLDNHTSNGADYHYSMTLITTHRDRQDQGVRDYLDIIEPKLYSAMAQKNVLMSPYVNVFGRSPDKGFAAFFENPRYSGGYVSLYGTVSFIAEAHMLKPFNERVNATYTFMQTLLEEVIATKEDLMKRGTFSLMATMKTSERPIDWKLDSSKTELLKFKGYEAGYKKSEISGQPRLFYNREAPYEKDIVYYNHYKVKTTIEKPFAYIIPAGYHAVAQRIIANYGLVSTFTQDTLLEVEQYKINNYQVENQPYEGRFRLKNLKVSLFTHKTLVRKGDYLVVLPDRFAIETLEPLAPDAFLAWGFFNSVLQQKEGYSNYVFEDLAIQILKDDSQLRQKFELKKKNDASFAKNAKAQLDFIYQNSDYYEMEHLLYPVMRLKNVIKLPTTKIN